MTRVKRLTSSTLLLGKIQLSDRSVRPVESEAGGVFEGVDSPQSGARFVGVELGRLAPGDASTLGAPAAYSLTGDYRCCAATGCCLRGIVV